MADLDQISFQLGSIQADMKHALRWFEEHEDRDQDRYDKLAAQIAVTAAFAPRIDRIEIDVANSKPVVELVRKARWVIAGFLGATALVGGTVGGMAAEVLKWFG